MEIQPQDDCSHSGFYSAVGTYSHESQTLRYVLICDECGEEMKEILAEEYTPNPAFESSA
jgi:hypothetical protein